MIESDFINEVRKRLNGNLPGHDSTHMMKGLKKRISPEQAIKENLSPRRSAVLLAFYPENEQWHTVFTLRHNYHGVHSNQVSLPGGKAEATDINLEFTALREANEEVGFPIDEVRIIGKLTHLYIPPSNFIVQPFVGYLESKPKLIPEEKEVKKIITCPVQRIFEDDVIKETELSISRYNSKYQVKYFDINNHIVWGATAMILNEFRSLFAEKTS